MKSEDLKKLIRTYVRQELNEALAEKYLQNIVKEAVSESLQLLKESLRDEEPVVVRTRVAKPQPPPTRVIREGSVVQPQTQKARNLAGNDPIMAEIFRDTLASNNPIITGEENATVEVSEAAMEKIGVFDRDWSKFVK